MSTKTISYGLDVVVNKNAFKVGDETWDLDDERLFIEFDVDSKLASHWLSLRNNKLRESSLTMLLPSTVYLLSGESLEFMSGGYVACDAIYLLLDQEGFRVEGMVTQTIAGEKTQEHWKTECISWEKLEKDFTSARSDGTNIIPIGSAKEEYPKPFNSVRFHLEHSGQAEYQGLVHTGFFRATFFGGDPEMQFDPSQGHELFSDSLTFALSSILNWAISASAEEMGTLEEVGQETVGDRLNQLGITLFVEHDDPAETALIALHSKANALLDNEQINEQCVFLETLLEYMCDTDTLYTASIKPVMVAPAANA